jgi:aspartokinase/homoserine dehydrogenase 1
VRQHAGWRCKQQHLRLLTTTTPSSLLLPPTGTQVLDLAAERELNGGAATSIKGFATIDNVCLINIEGTGMVGVPGELSRGSGAEWSGVCTACRRAWHTRDSNTAPLLFTGIASAVFSTVRDAGVNVIMISQASSEHSICFAVKDAEGDLAVGVLKKRFADSIAAGR